MRLGRTLVILFALLAAGVLTLLALRSLEPTPTHSGPAPAPLARIQPEEAARSPSPTTDFSKPVSVAEPSPARSPDRDSPNTSRSHLRWFYEPQFGKPLAIADPGYDKLVLEEAENDRDHANPWREKTFHAFDADRPFQIQVRPLRQPERMIIARLQIRRAEGANHLLPAWILTPERGASAIRYEGFASRYAEQEVYVGILSFPFDAFWRQVDPRATCAEITLIYDGLMSRVDSKVITGFDGRVFCRNGLRELRGIAHFRASLSDESAPKN